MKRKWLPTATKRCPDCKYRKHPSGTYDVVDDALAVFGTALWPHWCTA